MCAFCRPVCRIGRKLSLYNVCAFCRPVYRIGRKLSLYNVCAFCRPVCRIGRILSLYNVCAFCRPVCRIGRILSLYNVCAFCRPVCRIGRILSLYNVCVFCRPVCRIGRIRGACTHTGFLPESDSFPVVEFFTRTGITAAGGLFDFERCTRKMFMYIEIGSATCLCSYILGENTKNAKDSTGYIQF